MVYRALTKNDVLNVFIGFDSREPEAFEVAKSSILTRTSVAVNVQKLDERALRHSGLYWRTWHTQGVQKIDDLDGKPFSTEFSFTRFLVPSLLQWEGWGLFMDSDQLMLADIAELLKEMDPTKAVQVCKQNYTPTDEIKMDGMRQERYYRKNWSSFMLFNCAHPANKLLTPSVVSGEPGSWLHGLSWCQDSEIGDIDHSWNWIDGTSRGQPKNVHYTTGGPWFEHMRNMNAPYFEEWRSECKSLGIWRHMCERQDKAAA